MYTVKSTVPVGVVSAPLTVALSCTVDPIGAEVITSWSGLWMSVTVVESSFVPVSGSQAPSDALYVVEPL